MKEDTFKGSVLHSHIANYTKEQFIKYKPMIEGAIKHHENLTYTDENGNDYKGSKFWADALEFVEGKLKRKRS